MQAVIVLALQLRDYVHGGVAVAENSGLISANRASQPLEFTQGRMTYQLRRLRLHGLIERIPKTHRYWLTGFGFRVAVFCTRTYARILRSGLGLVLSATSSFPSRLRQSFDKIEQEVASWVDQAKLAA